MTYLQLINNVLTRLRENPTTQEVVDIGQDVYINFIGTTVNDAKARVEDAWQWSGLRDGDAVVLDPDVNVSPNAVFEYYDLPNSADNHYIIKGFYFIDGTQDPTRTIRVRQIVKQAMINRYSSGLDVIATGDPREVAVTGRNLDTGNINVRIFPPSPSGATTFLLIDRVRHQPDLDGTTASENSDNIDRNVLLVPSLPVYTLATALASRERGEVGGTPSSELFGIADRHLADSIAQDSALYANELDWHANDNEHNTNVRFA